MRAVVQRCNGAWVAVDGSRVGGFEGPGLTVLVGVARTDTEQQARKLAAKVWGLRLFEADRLRLFQADGASGHGPFPVEPSGAIRERSVTKSERSAPDPRAAPAETGPRELSASDLGLPLLVISQFTLYGRTTKGRRPTWEDAAPGPEAEPLVDAVVAELRRLQADVSTGIFGADMSVHLTNDGPFTVLLEV